MRKSSIAGERNSAFTSAPFACAFSRNALHCKAEGIAVNTWKQNLIDGAVLVERGYGLIATGIRGARETGVEWDTIRAELLAAHIAAGVDEKRARNRTDVTVSRERKREDKANTPEPSESAKLDKAESTALAQVEKVQAQREMLALTDRVNERARALAQEHPDFTREQWAARQRELEFELAAVASLAK